MTNFFEKMKQSIIEDFQGVAEVKVKQNPIALLNKYVRDSEKEVEKASKLVERQRLLKNEFYKEWKQATTLANKRKEQRDLAIQAGEHSLAETALLYQAQAEQQADRLQQAYETAIEQLSELEQKYEEMKLKVKDMHIKRLELMGKENVLSMKEKMNKLLSESEFGHAAENFETVASEMKQKESNFDDEYEITIFDAKIQKLAKEINNTEKQNHVQENVVQ
ncbi:PspA/IM30 family protein [Lederbergia wuyishanensis]|uniref:Phage shock protein A n=1 Tax=Lederbergia wuyishanensis TaxID=1347903 RepID=A0ABU0CZ93_9BACI|nr:PspA/IM30 family protein [Lederbergia wuyishanensis]MCJ8006108.1 PspA/IM30 family protein [Lederbergia wuyishanensis]MDQ0341477.1 phage shock protein A [Lederbergia wuyishanensis]